MRPFCSGKCFNRKKGKHKNVLTFFNTMWELEHTFGILNAYVKASVLNIDLNLVSTFSIRKAALMTSEIINDNKLKSVFNIYPSTLPHCTPPRRCGVDGARDWPRQPQSEGSP